MAGFIIQTEEEKEKLEEGLSILARIIARNILEEHKKQIQREAKDNEIN